MPKTWPLKRKDAKFTTRPYSSSPFEYSIPLVNVLRDMLGLAKSLKEVKFILNSREVMVNKQVRTNPKFSVSLMDVVELKKLKQHYRLLFNKNGKLFLHPIDAKESMLRPYKVLNKTVLKKNKVQLNLDNGINLLVKEDKFKVNSTILINTEKNAIVNTLPLDKGSLVYIIGGNKVSRVGKVEDIKQFKGAYPDNIIFAANNKSYETRKGYAFVIGKDKPIISLPNEQ